VDGKVCVVCRETMKSQDEFYSHCQQHHAAAITAAAVANANSTTLTPSSIPCIVCRQTLVSALELTLHARHHYANHPHPRRHDDHQQQQQDAVCCVCSSSDGLLAPLCTTNNCVYYICLRCERRDGLFQCIKCQRSFSSEDEVRQHVATHVLHDGNVHRCLLCDDMTFDSPARLQAHLISDHDPAGVADAVCDICGLTMSGPVAARQHSLQHCPTDWKHACSRCTLRFFFVAELRNHQLVERHDDDDAILPQHPASSSTSSSSGVDEQLQCSDERSYRRVRDKKNSSSVDTQRERSGSAPSQYISAAGTNVDLRRPESLNCPECSRQFPSLSSLQGHMRVHSSGASVCLSVWTSFITARLPTCVP